MYAANERKREIKAQIERSTGKNELKRMLLLNTNSKQQSPERIHM